MSLFWHRGPLFVREIVEDWPAQKPHFNTISTMVRALEERGFLGHEKFGGTFRYFAKITAEEFRREKLSGVVSRYFDNSYLGVVSSLVREEKIPLAELKKMIAEIERQ